MRKYWKIQSQLPALPFLLVLRKEIQTVFSIKKNILGVYNDYIPKLRSILIPLIKNKCLKFTKIKKNNNNNNIDDDNDNDYDDNNDDDNNNDNDNDNTNNNNNDKIILIKLLFYSYLFIYKKKSGTINNNK